MAHVETNMKGGDKLNDAHSLVRSNAYVNIQTKSP